METIRIGTLRIKEPVSALTHFIGVLLSLGALGMLVARASAMGGALHVASFAVFGASLVLLYSASTLYHAVDAGPKVDRLLKRIDHMMIFVLIAGTYTPVCLIPLEGTIGIVLLATVWGVAATGILLKAFWIHAPRWLSTGMYILMGWIVVFAIHPLFRSLSGPGFAWLVAGGVSYTIGGLVYGAKWPPFKSRWFGFHELFHVFVLAGSACHFILVYAYLV
ncbi:PAQR family membrane homeostasis protein TrhA [Anaerotalea alkaliphila]|uniref:Hemolysin III family protein n=1 Tax=Anaerotalea alkaliphila TaxID=2662126 RepID=A0A7X5KMI3_9FIRM|nr:hemolysin III family protein [Anaerotalea alkaliphila]NDL66753.1 hemolysin III family protein [Anaerotalea alkaliphila]